MNHHLKVLFGFSWLVLFAALTACGAGQGLPAAQSPVQAPAQAIGQRTKTSGCVSVNALPDPACTPGAIIADATKDQICQPGYSKNVRDVPDSEKNEVYAEYGIAHHTAGEYEVDHLISLELGGSNDIANLWPEPAEPRPGFHEKDQVENYLHLQMCSGAISLQDAQAGIANNWMQYYRAATGQAPPAFAPVPSRAPAQVNQPTVPSGGHRYVASKDAKEYYYCDTDPAYQSLKASNLIWADDPSTFTAKGLVLHTPCQ